MELHQIIDKSLPVEDSGLVNFKLLREVMHKIVEKLEKVEDSANFKEVPTTTVNNLTDRVESLHDSISRIMPPTRNIGNELSKMNKRISNIEEYVAAQTSTINELTRVFYGIEKQIYGEVDEIESLKESLDDLRHHLSQEKEVQAEGTEKFEKVSAVSGKGKMFLVFLRDLKAIMFFICFQRFSASHVISVTSSPSILSLPPTLKQSQSRFNMKSSSSQSHITITNNTFSMPSDFNDMQDEIILIKNAHQSDNEEVAEKLKIVEERLSHLEVKTEDEKVNLEINKKFHGLQESTTAKFKELEEIHANSMKMLREISCAQEMADKNMKILNENMSKLSNEKVKLQDLLTKKADYDVMKKVTTEHFDETKQNLKQVMEKMNGFQKEFGEMMDSKAGKEEVVKIADDVNNKINAVYDRLISLNSLKRENEAAGTKYRLFKGVKCITCDGDATMRVVENFSHPAGKFNPRLQSSAKKLVRTQTSPYPQTNQGNKIALKPTGSNPSISTIKMN